MIRYTTAYAGFYFLLIVKLTGAADALAQNIDEYCRQTYGHPGDLGVSTSAARYFSGNTSYHEAVATLGAQGELDTSSIGNSETYKWLNGKLMMTFQDDHLIRYRFGNGRWKALTSANERLAPMPAQKLPSKSEPDTERRERRREYEEFEREVGKVIEAGNQVTETDLERSDIHALQFSLPKLKEAVAADDWKQAQDIRDKMKIALQRSQGVAVDSQRRLTERQRADEERRHNEEMRQREQQHQEEMNKQQEIINELRWRHY